MHERGTFLPFPLQSLQAHRKALEIRLKVLETEHPNVTMSYNNLGAVYHSQCKHEEALQYHQQALEIRRKSFGDVHPDVMDTKYNIGLVLRATGKVSKARAEAKLC